jgi:serine protease
MLQRIVLLAGILFVALFCVSVLHADVRVDSGSAPQRTLLGRSLNRAPKDLPPRPRPTSVIVRFAPDYPEDQKDGMLGIYGCSTDRACRFRRIRRVRVPQGITPEEMALLLNTEQGVVYAEVNHYARMYLVPADPFYAPYQWHFQNDVTGGMGMEAAWDIETGDPNVIVAVLDTGVAYEDYGDYRQAPDLAYTQFVPGYDFVNDDAHPNDDQGHGTHVTGTIAQSTNNDEGVAGIAFGCSIMPIKVLDHEGVGDSFDIARGIYFAVDNGARVINMSLGSPERSTAIEEAVAYAYQHGVTVVCASGNAYEEGNPTSYPAAYDDYCIAVGAVRYDNTRSYYSNTGSYVDVVAPGGDLRVDQNGDGYPDGIIQQTFTAESPDFHYYFLQGTSMAAPHVSGVAALLLSQGVTDPDAVRGAIEGTARDLGPAGWDHEYGWGMIDAHAALLYRAVGDTDGDGQVTDVDLATLSNSWLDTGVPFPTADLNSDAIVNFTDFGLLAENWQG